MSRNNINKYVIELAQTIGGLDEPRLDDRIYADLRISGSDAVEFYEKLERHFGIDVRSVTEYSVEVSAIWFRKAHRKNIARDFSLEDLCAFIESKLG